MKTIVCPNCQNENPGSHLYCTVCGVSLAGVERSSGSMDDQEAKFPSLAPAPSLSEPERKPARIQAEKSHVGQSGCLTIWLVLALAVNAFSAIKYIYQAVTSGSVEVFISYLIPVGLLLMAVGFLFGIFKYKKWGVYGYVGIIILSIIFGILARDWLATLQPLIPLAILYFLIRGEVWGEFS